MKHVSFMKNASLGLIASVALLSSCGGSSSELPQPGVDVIPTNALVEQYINKDSLGIAPEGFAAYMDFSGIVYAYDDPTTQDNLKAIINKITGEKDWTFYSLADKKIDEIKADQTGIYNMMTDKEGFGQLFAPIEQALKQIVTQGKRALLVTDYEEYTPDGRIQQQNYAKQYFKQWIEKGNEITFYVTDYNENGAAKHLYYTIFDTPDHQLRSQIESALEGKPKNYQVFTVSNNVYKFTTEYANAQQGGTYHGQDGKDNVTVAIEDGSETSHTIYEGRNAEFCPWAAGDWASAKENADAFADPSIAAGDRYSHLIGHLFVDLSNTDSYKIDEFDVKVSDVTSDFNKYSYYMAGRGHAPEKKVSGNSTYFEFSSENEPYAIYYDINSGNLLPECDYTKGPGEVTEVKDFLDFSRAQIAQSIQKDRKKVELAIDFHKNFNGTQAQPSRLYRVDLVVSKSTPNINDEQLGSLFRWGTNNCLYDAVRNTLQDENPVGKVVYTYYIYMM